MFFPFMTVPSKVDDLFQRNLKFAFDLLFYICFPATEKNLAHWGISLFSLKEKQNSMIQVALFEILVSKISFTRYFSLMKKVNSLNKDNVNTTLPLK